MSRLQIQVAEKYCSKRALVMIKLLTAREHAVCVFVLVRTNAAFVLVLLREGGNWFTCLACGPLI